MNHDHDPTRPDDTAPPAQPSPPTKWAWRLREEDAAVVDHLLDGGDGMPDGQGGAAPGWAGVVGETEAQAEAGAAEPATRRARVRAWLSLIATAPADDPPAGLLERTMSRITRHRGGQAVVGRIGTTAEGHAVAFRWTELIALAAVLMLAVSLVWPLLSQARVDARRTECRNQLAAAGVGLTTAAADHQQAVPRYPVEPGAPWWRVGQPQRPDGTVQSNSAQLLLITKLDYVRTETLACPGNPYALRELPESAIDYPNHAAVSYSYQTQFTAEPMRIDRVPQMAILADRNPLLQIAQQRVQAVSRWGSTASTRMHGGVGQNVLLGDGRVVWTTDAVMPDGDNIWLPEGQSMFHTFREQPAREHDAVLVP